MNQQNDFVITNGILSKYNGTEINVTIPEGVKGIGENAFLFNRTV